MHDLIELLQASSTRACKRAAPWVEAFLAPSCAACHTSLIDGPPFCRACHCELSDALDSSGFHSRDQPPWRSIWRYESALRKTILLAKDNASCAAAYWLVHQFAERVGAPKFGRVWAMVPPSRKRRLQGWYLPEAMLAELHSRGHQTRPRLLHRLRQRPTQAGLDQEHRHQNLYGSFACKGAAPLQVVLVDDVRTTGSSLQESSRALRAMGARDVRALVLASPPLRRLE